MKHTEDSVTLVRTINIVMTWVYEGPMIPTGTMEALLTVESRATGRTTEVTLHHDGLTNPRYREGIQQGAWTKALDNVEALLSGPPPATP